jgi:hypothetical protein
VSRRRWTLEAARAILPDVRARTAEAVAEVDSLTARRDAAPVDSPQRGELEQQLSRVVSRWVRAMEALGVDVKGAWLVDFDSGSGCFCWRWPEQEIAFFHGYDEGFAGRARIQ